MAHYLINITEKKKGYHITGFPLLLMVAGWFFIIAQENNIAYWGTGIALLAFILSFIFRNNPKKLAIFTLDGFIMLSMLAFFLAQYFAGILLLVLAVAGFLANRPKQISINESGILFPSFIPKKYLWHEVGQVLLKDDVLTIDLKNNHLLQLVFSHNELDGIDKDQLNTFCNNQIALNNH